jgi:MEDS: MEthanogen/methylotroph, DcmR Sensory domain
MSRISADVKHSSGRLMSSPIVHSVHFYYDNAALVSRLCGIVKSALQIGNAVLIVGIKDHREDLVQALSSCGVNVREQARQRHFAMYDAEETLATFMRNHRPRRDLFMRSVGKLLRVAKTNSRSKDKGLTVFGEMVAVLWEQGKKKAAIELEALWNEALNDTAFHLHCAYPRASFAPDSDDYLLSQICNAHSHVTIQTSLRPPLPVIAA